jgi:predicted ester cyclase
VSEDNKALVRHWFDESDRLGRAPDELFAPDFVAHIPGSPDMDAAAFQQYVASFYKAFTDFSHTFDDMVAEGDRVAFRATSHATHTKDFAGITATGTQVEVGQIGIVRVADGMMAELWNSTDRLGMMQQLGALPAPAAAAR